MIIDVEGSIRFNIEADLSTLSIYTLILDEDSFTVPTYTNYYRSYSYFSSDETIVYLTERERNWVGQGKFMIGFFNSASTEANVNIRVDSNGTGTSRKVN